MCAYQPNVFVTVFQPNEFATAFSLMCLLLLLCAFYVRIAFVTAFQPSAFVTAFMSFLCVNRVCYCFSA